MAEQASSEDKEEKYPAGASSGVLGGVIRVARGLDPFSGSMRARELQTKPA